MKEARLLLPPLVVVAQLKNSLSHRISWICKKNRGLRKGNAELSGCLKPGAILPLDVGGLLPKFQKIVSDLDTAPHVQGQSVQTAETMGIIVTRS